MRFLKTFLAVAILFNFTLLSIAFGKNQLVFIDPKHDSTVPVYSLDKNGKPSKDPITALIPGDYATLKEVRKSDGFYIIQARDASGKEMDLAIDPKTLLNNGNPILSTAPANARNIKITGASKSYATPSPGMEDVVCQADKTNSFCQTVSPEEDLKVEDAVLAETTDGESSKYKWRNYYKSEKGLWVDSDNTSRVDKSWSMLEEPECEDKTAKPVPPEVEGSLSDLKNEVAKMGADKQLETIMQHVGDCHETKVTGNYHQELIDSMANKELPGLVKEYKGPNGNVVLRATQADWVAIDVMARTLYGEMASCFSKGKQYPKTVAKVVLNRVDFNEDKPALGARFINAKDSSDSRNEITNAIFKDKQFSVWNRKDAARRMAMCPPSNANKDFWNGSKPSENEQNIWKEAVRISSQAVLSGQSFRASTKDLTALYYTSNFEMSKEDYKPITDASIGGQAVPLSRCVQLWAAKDLKKWAPEHGMLFHPLFREIFYQIAAQ